MNQKYLYQFPKQRKGTGKIAFIGGKRISLVVKWI